MIVFVWTEIKICVYCVCVYNRLRVDGASINSNSHFLIFLRVFNTGNKETRKLFWEEWAKDKKGNLSYFYVESKMLVSQCSNMLLINDVNEQRPARMSS